ncbi:MAG: hypothetical protein K6E91_05145, partial [Butyrivibrio sp.]|nr:hypothetical protein [Butyrivibrio sp.]
LRLCILHKQLRGPMSSSVLSEVFSSLVPLRSERSESVPEVIVQYAQPWRRKVTFDLNIIRFVAQQKLIRYVHEKRDKVNQYLIP